MRRPNARINDAKRRQAARKAGDPTLPPVVQSRIAEAGASAYQWRDKVLLDLYQPPFGVRVGLRIAFYSLQVVTAVAVIAVSATTSPLLVVASLVAPTAALVATYVLRKEVAAPPALAWMLASAVAAYPMIASGAWGFLGAGVLVLAVLASADVEHPVRGVVSAWVSAVLTLVFAGFALAAGMVWGVVFAWVLALIVVQVPVCVAQRSFRVFAHRITPEDLAIRIPPPEFKWEPLARFVRRVAGVLDSIPVMPVVLSAFSANGWISDMIDGPSEAVMGDALKRAAGGYGERKTGVFLLGLERRQGTMILHDIDLPGAKSANIDHVVIGAGRDGAPCAFIIDSKFYGQSRLRGHDPGEVVYDTGSQGYAYRQGMQNRSIDQSISTALWGADAVRRVTGIEDVRVIMAIHNADVAPNLVFERDGVPVETITAWDLVRVTQRNLSGKKSWARRGVSPLSPLQEARVAQGFVSASTSQSPEVVAPLGLTSRGREFMETEARKARGRGVPSQGNFGSFRSRPGSQTGPVQSSGPPVTEYPPARPTVSAEESPPSGVPDPVDVGETAFEKADREFFEGDPSEWADDSVPPMPVPLAESAQERLEGQWEQMRNSVPAPLDDVPVEYHQVVRGTPLTLTGFSEANGPTARDVVAITGVCVGAPGELFLWFCSEEGWREHETSGTPVFISTIGIGSVVVRSGGE